MEDKTLRGALYFATFIDDFSRKLWCFALRTNGQVFEIFRNFHVSVERETREKLNVSVWIMGVSTKDNLNNIVVSIGSSLRGVLPKYLTTIICLRG